jgi:hypothetical protein
MTNSFKTLAEFFDQFNDEVQGRDLGEPPEEIQVQLRSLAQGGLPARDQPELFALLNQNPEWVAGLAREVKALRKPPQNEANQRGR